jgi:hypothetical protein
LLVHDLNSFPVLVLEMQVTYAGVKSVSGFRGAINDKYKNAALKAKEFVCPTHHKLSE